MSALAERSADVARPSKLTAVTTLEVFGNEPLRSRVTDAAKVPRKMANANTTASATLPLRTVSI